MTTISAKVIAHSRCVGEVKEILTFQLRYPRFIHAEFMTHRQLSRNASSSRAIPVKRMIEDMRRDPAMPMFWGKNQKGMQAGEEHNEPVILNLPNSAYEPGAPDKSLEYWPTTLQYRTKEAAWLCAMEKAIEVAEAFDAAGYHKQVVNRILEPFLHINVVVTSTEWSNFYALRDHPDAEPHIRLLARRMQEAAFHSTPTVLLYGQWHLPYVSPEELMDYGIDKAKAMSTARCARVSYLTHDGRTPSVDEDVELYTRLVGTHPLHASPAEHQATPDPFGEFRSQWGNFSYWKQHRKTLPGECQ